MAIEQPDSDISASDLGLILSPVICIKEAHHNNIYLHFLIQFVFLCNALTKMPPYPLPPTSHGHYA